MLETMNSYNRFNPAIRRITNDKKLNAAEKQKKLTELQAAINKFFADNRATAEKFTKQTDTEEAKLNIAGFTAKCPEICQDYSSKQEPSASSLMKVPTTFCTSMNTAYTKFQNEIDSQRTKIAA